MISVIVPNFNHGAFLEERLDSILAQTFTDFEIIILDDCSTDNSREVIAAFASNPKVSRIVYNEKNSGSPFVQWRKGLELACGDIIWIAESDDSCTPVFLETLMPAFEADPDCVVSFCSSEMTGPEGEPLGIHPNLVGMPSLDMPGQRFNRRFMSRCNMVVNASSALFRKSAAMAVDNGYDTLGGYGDYMFWVGILEQGNVHYCDAPLNRFRFHSANTTGRMTVSEKGTRESLVTNRFLYRSGLVGPLRYALKKTDLEYRLKYVCGAPGPSFPWNAAVALKRCKRLICRQKDALR